MPPGPEARARTAVSEAATFTIVVGAVASLRRPSLTRPGSSACAASALPLVTHPDSAAAARPSPERRPDVRRPSLSAPDVFIIAPQPDRGLHDVSPPCHDTSLASVHIDASGPPRLHHGRPRPS